MSVRLAMVNESTLAGVSAVVLENIRKSPTAHPVASAIRTVGFDAAAVIAVVVVVAPVFAAPKIKTLEVVMLPPPHVKPYLPLAGVPDAHLIWATWAAGMASPAFPISSSASAWLIVKLDRSVSVLEATRDHDNLPPRRAPDPTSPPPVAEVLSTVMTLPAVPP